MTAKKIRKLRARAGLTQARLAALLGLGAGGQVTVSRWEAGTQPITEPHARLLEMVCRRAAQ